MKKRRLSFVLLLILLSTTVVVEARDELEPNNSYSTANRIYDGDNNYGAISSSSDVDWWWIQFDTSGKANFWLSDIPTGCNFDLYVYDSTGTNLLSSSTKAGRYSELIQLVVTAGVRYYIKVKPASGSGSSSQQYVLRVKCYPPVVVNRMYSTYSDTAVYRDQMINKMNCYGYALHVYCKNNQNVAYGQQPGEFTFDSIRYSDNVSERLAVYMDASKTDADVVQYFYDLVKSDINSLYSEYGNEWLISKTTAHATVPSGYRKIALSIGRGSCDYHFYVRHDDGTWSHKPGSSAVTNMSFSVNGQSVALTDGNIAGHVTDAPYNNGVVYFMVKKPLIIDYRHSYGHDSNTLNTSVEFLDRAGDSITKSITITVGTKQAYIDYSGDLDYYVFTPSTSRNYTVSAMNTGTSSVDPDMIIYDAYGLTVSSQENVGNEQVSVALTANSKYFIRVKNKSSVGIGTYSLTIS